MRREDNSDLISSEMIRIMGSDEHKKLFNGSLRKIAQEQWGGYPVTDENGLKVVHVNTEEEASKLNSGLETGTGLPEGYFAKVKGQDVNAGPTNENIYNVLKDIVESPADPSDQAAAQKALDGSAGPDVVERLVKYFPNFPREAVVTSLSMFAPNEPLTNEQVTNTMQEGLTTASVIRDLVIIGDYLGSKGMETSEALATHLIRSIAIDKQKALRKQADKMNEMLMALAGEDDPVSSLNKKDEDDTEEKDEDDDDENSDTGKCNMKDQDMPGQDEELAFGKEDMEDGTEDELGESSVVPY